MNIKNFSRSRATSKSLAKRPRRRYIPLLEALESRLNPGVVLPPHHSLELPDGQVLEVLEFDWSEHIEVISTELGSDQFAGLATGQINLGRFRVVTPSGSVTPVLVDEFFSYQVGQAEMLMSGPVTVSSRDGNGHVVAQWTMQDVFLGSYQIEQPSGRDELILYFGGLTMSYDATPTTTGFTHSAGVGDSEDSPNTVAIQPLPTRPGHFLTFADGDTVELTGYTWGAEHPIIDATDDFDSLPRVRPGTLRIDAFQVTAPLSLATPELMYAPVVAGQISNSRQDMRVTSRATDGSVLEWLLEDAFIDSYGVSATEGGAPQDAFTIRFDDAIATHEDPSQAAAFTPGAQHFLELPDGEVLQVVEFDWTEHVEVTSATGGSDQFPDLLAGLVDLGRFRVVTPSGRATPSLLQQLEDPDYLLPGPVTVSSYNDFGLVVARWEMEDVFFGSYQTEQPAGLDELTLYFRGLTMSYDATPGTPGFTRSAGVGESEDAPNSVAVRPLPNGPGHFLTFADGDTVALSSYTWGEEHTIVESSGVDNFYSRVMPGVLRIDALHLTAPTGVATPELMYAPLLFGETANPRQDMRLTSRSADGSVLEWELGDAFIDSYGVSGAIGTSTQDAFTIRFYPIRVIHTGSSQSTVATQHSLELPDGQVLEVIEFDWTEQLELPTANDGPFGVAHMDLGRFRVVTPSGRATPSLFNQIDDADFIIPGPVTVSSRNALGQLVARWTMEDVFFGSFQTEQPAGLDELTLYFRGLTMSYDATPQTAGFTRSAGVGESEDSPNAVAIQPLPDNPGHFLTFADGDTVALTSYTWGERYLITPAPSLETHYLEIVRSHLTIDEFVITAPLSLATPELMFAPVNRSNTRQDMRLTSRAADGSVLEWRLPDTVIGSYGVSGSTANSTQDIFTIHVGGLVEAIFDDGINAPPVFVKGPNLVILEDSPLQTVPGWATGISPGAGDVGQVLTFIVTHDNLALFAIQPTISAQGTLSYRPAANVGGLATVTVQLQDDGTGLNISPSQTFTIKVLPVNDVPVFVKGPDQTRLEDAGSQVISSWATGIQAGPANESGQLLTFLVSNDNPVLFAAQPALTPNGSLSFTPAPNANGVVIVAVQLQDNGGGSNTSAAQTFVIKLVPVNDPPSFTKGLNQTVLEDAGLQSVAGWATGLSAGPSNEAAQGLAFLVTNSNNSLFAAQPTVDSTGRLSYTPAANANGTAMVTVLIKDNGLTANGGVDTSAAQVFTIAVTPVNDADLAVTVTESPNPAGLQRDLTYAITILNNGPDTATGVAVSLPIPAGSTFKSSSLVPKGIVNGMVIWNAGNIANGAKMTITMTVGVLATAPKTLLTLAQTSTSAQEVILGNNQISRLTSVVSVGTFELEAPRVVEVGDRVPVALTWTLPGGRWRELKTVDLRFRDQEGVIVLVRFDEASNTLALYNPESRRFGHAVTVGSSGVLSNEFASIQVKQSSVVASGPTSPSVMLTLDVTFKEHAAWRTFDVEVAAADDLGNSQDFEKAGAILVIRRHQQSMHYFIVSLFDFSGSANPDTGRALQPLAAFREKLSGGPVRIALPYGVGAHAPHYRMSGRPASGTGGRDALEQALKEFLGESWWGF